MNPKIQGTNLENVDGKKKAELSEQQQMLKLRERNGEKPRRARRKDTAAVHRARNPTERIFAIRQLVADKKYPNCETLAEQFEHSTKTIKRDIQWIRDHWSELRITFDPRRNGYYFACP